MEDNLLYLKEKYEELKKIRENREKDEFLDQKKILETFSTSYCPIFEELERKINNDVDIYEDKFLIKKYFRSAAGNKAVLIEDIRNTNTLESCLNHLLDIEIDKNSFKFVDNRIRAIKLDLEFLINEKYIENIKTKRIKILEKISKFYILAIYQLYGKEDLYIIMEQLRKTLTTLISDYKEKEENYEFLAYFILSNLKDPDIFIKFNALSQKDLYIKNSLDLAYFYQFNDFYKIFRLKLDFMTFSIFLYYLDQFKIKTATFLIKSFNEKINIKKINKLLNFNTKYLFEAFYYDIENINEEKFIDFKIKNKKNKEIKKNTLKKINITKYLIYGNIDFQIYNLILKNYIKSIFLFNKIKILYLKNKYKEKLNKIQKKRMNLKLITNNLYLLISKTYIKMLIYKIILKKYFYYKLKSSEIYKIIKVSEIKSKERKRIEIKDKKLILIDFIELYYFSVEIGLRYNLTIFYSDKIDFLNKKFFMLNKLFNIKNIEEIIFYKKVKKMKLEDLPTKREKLEELLLLKNNENYTENLDDILEDIIEDNKYRNITIYKK